jgi:hypothetical protein
MPPKLKKEIPKPKQEKLNPLHRQRHLLWTVAALNKGSGTFKGQRLSSTGHGTHLWTAATSHSLQNPFNTGHGTLVWTAATSLAYTAAGKDGGSPWLRQEGSWNLHQPSTKQDSTISGLRPQISEDSMHRLET